jgi:hypothetical protein
LGAGPSKTKTSIIPDSDIQCVSTWGSDWPDPTKFEIEERTPFDAFLTSIQVSAALSQNKPVREVVLEKLFLYT